MSEGTMPLYLLYMSMRFAGIPFPTDTPGAVVIYPCSSETVGAKYDGKRLYPWSDACAYVDGVLIVKVAEPNYDPNDYSEMDTYAGHISVVVDGAVKLDPTTVSFSANGRI